MPGTVTQYGFQFEAALVERLASYKGYAIVGIKTRLFPAVLDLLCSARRPSIGALDRSALALWFCGARFMALGRLWCRAGLKLRI